MRLDQALLKKLAAREGKDVKYVRERVSRRAGKEGVSSSVALIAWARELGIGVANAVNRLPPHLQQQLSQSHVVVSRAMPATAPRRRRSVPSKPSRAADAKIVVFISHSSQDKALAKALVELIQAALHVRAEKIRCTSVDGYRLPAGADSDEQLRAEIIACGVLVGIISPASRQSTYVLFELGARWGVDKPLFPMLGSGMPANELKGPLAGKNALDCSSEAQVMQFVGELGTMLRMNVEPAHVFLGEVAAVVRASKRGARANR